MNKPELLQLKLEKKYWDLETIAKSRKSFTLVILKL